MAKRPFIILAIIMSVLSIIYSFLSYFGLIRYTTLMFKDPTSFVESYKKLDKASENRVVISLTTTGDRINKIKPVINSLLDQTVKVEQIALNVPYKVKVPKDIEDVVSVYKYSKKYGQEADIIPTLLREKETDTKIIVVRDNIIYGKDFIEDMVSSMEKNPGKAVFLEGSWHNGYLVEPGFFPEGFENMPKSYNSYDWVFDQLKKNKVEIVTLKYKENYKSF